MEIEKRIYWTETGKEKTRKGVASLVWQATPGFRSRDSQNASP